jgi:hypothetical protein
MDALGVENYKSKAECRRAAQQQRKNEVDRRAEEKQAEETEKREKKVRKHNRRYKPKYTDMASRRYMVQVEKTHRWCGGMFFQCHGNGHVNGMRHAPCRGNGIIRVRAGRPSKPKGRTPIFS